VNPDILMIDEVIAVGDEEFQRRCFDHLYQLRREGVTIVMVSHSAPLMEQMCDEVSWPGPRPAPDDGLGIRSRTRVSRPRDTPRTNGSPRPPPSRTPSRGTAHGAGGRARSKSSASSSTTRAETCSPRRVPATRSPSGFDYHAKNPVAQPVFGLGFTTESGVRVAGPNTRFAGIDTGLVHGEGYVDYVTDRFGTDAGTWHLSVAVVDETMLQPSTTWISCTSSTCSRVRVPNDSGSSTSTVAGT